jgi:hypothetical protein
MVKTKPPQKVLAMTGLIFVHNIRVDDVLNALKKDFGEVLLKSEVLPFIHTTYYNKEMGDDLLRQWCAFDNLVVPDVLADMKHRTNENGGRKVNIDPGFITLSNLILASTKDFSHRIYIGKGIYAEVTFIYKNKAFVPLEWTYPDHQEPKALEFFQKAREILKNRLSKSL